MMQVPYTTELFEEDGQIVALCPELNVSSFGDTLEEALRSLQEAITLFLEECQRMGTLDAVLEEAGYRREPLAPQRWFYRQPIQINRLEAVLA
jgi:predicted RNase H-like HicB family nuclease